MRRIFSTSVGVLEVIALQLLILVALTTYSHAENIDELYQGGEGYALVPRLLDSEQLKVFREIDTPKLSFDKAKLGIFETLGFRLGGGKIGIHRIEFGSSFLSSYEERIVKSFPKELTPYIKMHSIQEHRLMVAKGPNNLDPSYFHTDSDHFTVVSTLDGLGTILETGEHVSDLSLIHI